MTAEAVSSRAPTFSRDGKRLYFVSERNDGESRVWFLDLVNGGEAQQLTDLDRGIDTINFSRDEKRLLLTLQDPDPDKDPEEKWIKGKPWVIDRIQFKEDYTGYLDRRRDHIYVYDIESKRLTQVTSGDYDDSSPAWSPDGKTIAFVSNRTEEPDTNYNNSIWLVDADNADKGKNLVQLTTSPGTEYSPTWHPNGKTIAYGSAPDVLGSEYATRHLAVIDVRGGEPRLLTKELDRNVSGLEFSKDGKYIYFQLEDSGENHIARIPAGGGRITRPISGQLRAGSYSLADNGTLVARISMPKLPGELFISDENGLRQLTRSSPGSTRNSSLRSISVKPKKYISRVTTASELKGLSPSPLPSILLFATLRSCSSTVAPSVNIAIGSCSKPSSLRRTITWSCVPIHAVPRAMGGISALRCIRVMARWSTVTSWLVSITRSSSVIQTPTGSVLAATRMAAN
jgi:dipeptidyl aminopeptidase/acylaminoacyl peptidase